MESFDSTTEDVNVNGRSFDATNSVFGGVGLIESDCELICWFMSGVDVLNESVEPVHWFIGGIGVTDEIVELTY